MFLLLLGREYSVVYLMNTSHTETGCETLVQIVEPQKDLSNNKM